MLTLEQTKVLKELIVAFEKDWHSLIYHSVGQLKQQRPELAKKLEVFEDSRCLENDVLDFILEKEFNKELKELEDCFDGGQSDN